MKMNKKSVALITIAVSLAALFFYSKRNDQKFESAITKKKTELAFVEDSKKNKASESKPKLVFEKETFHKEFDKCFKSGPTSDTFAGVLQFIKKRINFSDPITISENYELISASQKEIVVQYISQEEDKNKVRVFTINAKDGLPDRLKEFPNSDSSAETRLVGALSLGQLKNKTTSTTQNAYDGSVLNLDQSNDQIIRIHLMTNSFDFECKNQNCFCLKKE